MFEFVFGILMLVGVILRWYPYLYISFLLSHLARGAWIEALLFRSSSTSLACRTSHEVRGLKSLDVYLPFQDSRRTSHEVRGLKSLSQCFAVHCYCCTSYGVRHFFCFPVFRLFPVPVFLLAFFLIICYIVCVSISYCKAVQRLFY